jgi:hypothetical protein
VNTADLLAKPADYARKIERILDEIQALDKAVSFRSTMADVQLLRALKYWEEDGYLTKPAIEVFASLAVTGYQYPYDPFRDDEVAFDALNRLGYIKENA